MTRTITGMFDSSSEADLVVEQLVQRAGVDRSAVRVYAADAGTNTATTASEDRGFWASLKDLPMRTALPTPRASAAAAS
jgi:hypothetical protein